MSDTGKPVPAVTPEMQPFFDGATRHELWLQRCTDCGSFRFPARELCSSCLSPSSTWERASGGGEVFSFTIMHQVYHPAFAAEAPYGVVIVKLDEGPKLTSNLRGVSARDVRIGTRVEVAFEEFGEVTLPVFRPASS